MKILLVGDVMLGRLVNDILKKENPKYPWGDTLRIFKMADLRICNLECVIADIGRPWTKTPKTFHFKSDAQNIEVLKVAQINLVSLANNHTLDFGYNAMRQMIKILKDSSISYAGAGENLDKASKPAKISNQNLKIVFISFTDNQEEWQAKTKTAGIFYVPINLKDPRAKYLLDLVKKTKRTTDLLIVLAHWGPNWGYQPEARHVTFAHALIEVGADLIFGHSAHVFQGIEIYKNRPIIYSAGDFVDDYAVDEIERNDESFIFFVETLKDKIIKLKLYPTIIKDFQAKLAPSKLGKVIAQKMQNLCQDFNTKSFFKTNQKCLIIPIN